MLRETLFSPDRRYRYTLWRDWSKQIDEGLHFTEDPHLDFYPGKSDGYVQFIGLNPSTADETNDDPTVRRCIRYSKSWGFGAYCMTNIFAFRATDPRDMKAAADPIGPENDRYLLEVAKSAGFVVCAWGTHGAFKDRGNHVAELLRSNGIKPYCLKITQGGAPGHPLYLKHDITPMPYGKH